MIILKHRAQMGDNETNEGGDPEKSENAFETNFSIQVVDPDGEPIEGVKVTVLYDVFEDYETTDEDGWAYFLHQTWLQKMMEGHIHVREVRALTRWNPFNGQSEEILAEDLAIEDGDSFSFTFSNLENE